MQARVDMVHQLAALPAISRCIKASFRARSSRSSVSGEKRTLNATTETLASTKSR